MIELQVGRIYKWHSYSGNLFCFFEIVDIENTIEGELVKCQTIAGNVSMEREWTYLTRCWKGNNIRESSMNEAVLEML